MHVPPVGFEVSRLQGVHEKQTIQTGDARVTHTGNTLHEVHLETNGSSLTLSLLKGGTIVSTRLLGEELFDRDADYQDVTQVTRTKGNPNIFPVFNQMPEGMVLAGATSPLPNHGIARNETWQAYILPDCPGMLVLRLQSNERTKAYYPHDFTYTQFITLDRDSLTIGQQIETDGAFAVGFHPYFRIRDKRHIDIVGLKPGTRYWYLPNALRKAEKDEVIAQNQSLAYVPDKQGSLNFDAGEVNHHFDVADYAGSTISLTDPGLNRRIRIDTSDAYQGITVWCNADEEHAVCVEPVTDRSGMLSLKSTPWKGHVRYTVEHL